MRVLVLGADGFVGRWLVRHLANEGDEIDAVVGPRYEPPLQHARRLHRADVRDPEALGAVVADSRPDVIYNLVAVSEASVREQLGLAASIGVAGAVNAVSSAAGLAPTPTFVQVSSSHVYGAGSPEPMDETTPVQPTTVYGATKAAAEQAVLLLGQAAGMRVMVARAFNHIGCGQRHGFLVPSLAGRVARLAREGSGTLELASADAIRDFTDVRDVVRAYRLIALSGAAGQIYTVASGLGISIRQLAEMMLAEAGVTADIQAVPGEPSRDGEPPVLIGNPTRLRQLGWSPLHSLQETIRDVLACHSAQPDLGR